MRDKDGNFLEYGPEDMLKKRIAPEFARIEKKYPNKKIEYGILKEEWDVPGKTKCSRYVYMSTRGIKIFDTYTFIEDNYGISKNELIDDVNNFEFAPKPRDT